MARGRRSNSKTVNTFHNKQNRARAVLNKPREAYTVSSIELAGTFSYAEARKEYSRLRNIALKRLDRLAQAGYSDSDIYKYNAGRYPTLKEISTNRQLYEALSSLAWFITAKGSTVSGQREYEETMRSTLSERFGTPEDMDLKKFGAFMEYMRAKYQGKDYDSERSARVYRESLKKGITLQQLERHQKIFYENEASLTRMKSRTKGMSSDRTALDYVKAIKKRNNKRG